MARGGGGELRVCGPCGGEVGPLVRLAGADGCCGLAARCEWGPARNRACPRGCSVHSWAARGAVSEAGLPRRSAAARARAPCKRAAAHGASPALTVDRCPTSAWVPSTMRPHLSTGGNTACPQVRWPQSSHTPPATPPRAHAPPAASCPARALHSEAIRLTPAPPAPASRHAPRPLEPPYTYATRVRLPSSLTPPPPRASCRVPPCGTPPRAPGRSPAPSRRTAPPCPDPPCA
jgi:hypothetical protein